MHSQANIIILTLQMRKLSFREMPKGTQAIVSKDEIQTSFQVQHASNCSTLPIERYKYLRGCHDRAVLLYEYVGKRIVDLQHTEVPDAYRGRGIAKHLAKAALDFVVEEDLKAHLTCWYIQKYVKENPLPQYLERLQP
uniref:Protein NATD1 n=1 Tax=Sarcophilus harrisii TaxID=9305 RepID=A0A7N4V880_SARHA